MSATYQPGLHRFAVLLASSVIVLISAGALVTSTGSGLSVPDWPLSYGSLNPPNWWTISTVRAEHGHRLIAGTVALLTAALALWARLGEPRRWVRRLAYLALAAVLTQALLGGLTVLFFLPTPISVGHAALAEIFLCLTVALALVTSRWWHEVERRSQPVSGARRLFATARVTAALVFLQILLGAVMRHSGAGLAIPDFPLVFGGLVPPHFDFGIAIHYSHRLGALVATAAIAVTVARAFGLRDGGTGPRWLGAAMAVLLGLQIALGGAVVLTGKATLPNTAHVATGATLLATTLLMTLTAFRLAGGARVTAARREATSGTCGATSAHGAQPDAVGGA